MVFMKPEGMINLGRDWRTKSLFVSLLEMSTQTQCIESVLFFVFSILLLHP